MDYAQCALGRGVSDLEEWQGALALAVQVTRTRVVSGQWLGERRQGGQVRGRREAGARQAQGRSGGMLAQTLRKPLALSGPSCH
jgi:hypothetical protein